ncbi:MAG: NUDIX domain-containing protein [Pseudomonadales bacterium]
MANIHCPKCSEPKFEPIGRKKLLCSSCGFQFYRNAASAVAVIIRCDDEMLLAVRGREPCKGMFDLPGGFVDPGESLEQAARREVKEELQLELDQFQYVCSEANQYLFAEVTYDTTDAFFEARFASKPFVQASDDVAAVEWQNISDINLEDFAFESQRIVLARHFSLQQR